MRITGKPIVDYGRVLLRRWPMPQFAGSRRPSSAEAIAYVVKALSITEGELNVRYANGVRKFGPRVNAAIRCRYGNKG
jgi:hypothetical protein